MCENCKDEGCYLEEGIWGIDSYCEECHRGDYFKECSCDCHEGGKVGI